MMTSHESKMLPKVRRWREKAYEADQSKPLAERAEETDELARELDLPVARPRKAGK